MQTFDPLISIVIPVYNGADYMRQAIDSAIAQTYKNIEIIVVNDGSNDGGETERIAKAYGDRIRYISKENGGVSTALNTGIAHMRGEYFSWLSHDDVYTQDKVEKEVRALAQLSDKNTLILCRSTPIDKNSDPIRTAVPAKRETLPENEVIPWNTALMQLLKEGSFNGCAFLIPKVVFDRCGGFDEDLRFNQDGFMWNKIFLNKYSLFCIPDIGVLGRIHEKQLTQTRQDLFHRDCGKMSEYLIPAFEMISTRKRNFLYEYIKYNARYANKDVVKKAYTCASQAKLLDLPKRGVILVLRVWGCVRPMIRRVYYALFHKVKTA